ncbi:MAG TPA: hypothetical protein VGY58_16680 [Gemmataceae bacterium]|jgi:hypothetical protein|nr:hypothetical protein [Gemmataceae bacterium]
MNQANRQRRVRAPQEDGAVLAEPPLSEAGTLIAANRRRLATQQIPILNRPLAELRRLACVEALAAAREYLRTGEEPLPNGDRHSLLMAGHQPELFHPGVWVKNFALNRLARLHDATPVNLVVDNDIAKSTTLRVPVLATPETPFPHIAHVPFDRWTGEVPYEERPVRDEAFFAEVPSRVAPFLEGWNFEPLLPDFWQEVRKHSARTPLLGERFARARRALERRWGCDNLELPVSILCRTESFAWFAAHLLAQLSSFHAIYNSCVHEHRRLYGIRSRNHPVPDLAREGDWLEVPLWAWKSGAGNRDRLFARQTATQIELRAGREPWPGLPLPGADVTRLVQAWRSLETRGFKIRSRALTNTLFARLLLADLFVHGIGGGKYDELTDAMIRRFFQIEPPHFLVLSATLLLPFAKSQITLPLRRQLAQVQRDLRYNPQRHLSDGDAVDHTAQQLRAEKQGWIDRQPQSAAERRQRFQTLRRLTGQLAPYVAGKLTEVKSKRAQAERDLDAVAVLQRRDYAFCLYPEALLWQFCGQFLEP